MVPWAASTLHPPGPSTFPAFSDPSALYRQMKPCQLVAALAAINCLRMQGGAASWIKEIPCGAHAIHPDLVVHIDQIFDDVRAKGRFRLHAIAAGE